MSRSRELLTEEHAAMYRPGESYRPSNGTEGELFMDLWCAQCPRDSESSPCPILLASMAFEVDDPKYPKEWVHDAAGQPSCTGFFQDPPAVVAVKPLPGQLSLFGDTTP